MTRPVTPIQFSMSFANGLNAHIMSSFANLGEQVAADASVMAPVDTGALAGHFKSQTTRDGSNARVDISSMYYGIYRNYINHKNPQTVHYLDRAVTQATERPESWLDLG